MLGRLRLDFKAAAGTIVDATYTERLKPTAYPMCTIASSRTWPSVISRARGCSSWHSMHPRGGRYVEVWSRGDIEKFKLHAIAMTRANYPVQPVGIDDLRRPAAQRDLGPRHAHRGGVHGGCLSRLPRCASAGLYAGDMLVQYLVNLAAFGDHRLLRRCIEIFLYRQRPREWADPRRRPGAAGRAASGLLGHPGAGDLAVLLAHRRQGLAGADLADAAEDAGRARVAEGGRQRPAGWLGSAPLHRPGEDGSRRDQLRPELLLPKGVHRTRASIFEALGDSAVGGALSGGRRETGRRHSRGVLG